MGFDGARRSATGVKEGNVTCSDALGGASGSQTESMRSRARCRSSEQAHLHGDSGLGELSRFAYCARTQERARTGTERPQGLITTVDATVSYMYERCLDSSGFSPVLSPWLRLGVVETMVLVCVTTVLLYGVAESGFLKL